MRDKAVLPGFAIRIANDDVVPGCMRMYIEKIYRLKFAFSICTWYQYLELTGCTLFECM